MSFQYTLEQINQFLTERDESHGIGHAIATREVASQFRYKTPETRAAAYLHDVNDHKYVGKNPLDISRALAECILAAGPVSESKLQRLVLACLCAIEHNSYSKEVKWLEEGTSAKQLIIDKAAAGDFDADTALEIWRAVSAADKSQAMGIIGIVRTWQYTEEKTPAREDIFYGVLHHAAEKLIIVLEMVPPHYRPAIKPFECALCEGLEQMLGCIRGFTPTGTRLREQLKQAVDERRPVDMEEFDRIYAAFLRKILT